MLNLINSIKNKGIATYRWARFHSSRFLWDTLISLKLATIFPESNEFGANKNLTDARIEVHLPEMLARAKHNNSIDLQGNKLGATTIDNLARYLPNSIKHLNLNNNLFDQDARAHLPSLISELKLESLDLNNCNLTASDIKLLSNALASNTTLTTLNFSGPKVSRNITNLLDRNKLIYELRGCIKNDILDLRNITLTDKHIGALSAFLIDLNANDVWERRLPNETLIRKIYAPFIEEEILSYKFETLSIALAAHNGITDFVTPKTTFSEKQREKINLQMMLNKAKRKIKSSTFNSNAFDMLITGLSLYLFPLMQPWIMGGYFIRYGIRSGANTNFHVHKEREPDNSFNKPKEKRDLELGKKCAHNALYYLHPKSWTPLAYLGYTVEKNNLASQYEVETLCFKPISKPKPN